MSEKNLWQERIKKALWRGFLFLLILPVLLGLFFAFLAIWGERPFLGSFILNQKIFQVSKGSEVKILFVGDMFFDRYIRAVAREKGGDYIFSCAEKFIQSADFAVGNLEGPITEMPSKSEGTAPGSAENFYFTFPPETAELLAKRNFRAVNLGNNHIGNEGPEGIVSTRAALDKAAVGYFGGLSSNEPIYRTAEKGQEFSFIGFNEFGGGSPERVAEKIASEREAGRTVFVYAHWGDEYSEGVSRLRPIAAAFAEAGAAAVIGSHPHIVLPSESVDGAFVYYSLGNFIFDQYWNDEVRTGLAVIFKVSDGKISVEERKIVLEPDGRTCPE